MTKPGWTTTEFWTHLLTVAVAAGVAVAGVIHPGYTVPAAEAQAALPAAVVLAAISQAVYTWSRTRIKTAAAPATMVTQNVTTTGRTSEPTITVGPPANTMANTGTAPPTWIKPMPKGPVGVHPNADTQTVAHPGALAAAPPLPAG